MEEVRQGELLAVYGELLSRPDEPRVEGLMSGMRLLGPCWIPGELYDLGAYPGLVPGDGQVLGELYEVGDPSAFTELDWFEQYDRGREAEAEYVRRRLNLIEPKVAAWVYVYNRDPADAVRVASGDWRGHNAGRMRLR